MDIRTELEIKCAAHQKALEHYLKLRDRHTKDGLALTAARHQVNLAEQELSSLRHEITSLAIAA